MKHERKLLVEPAIVLIDDAIALLDTGWTQFRLSRRADGGPCDALDVDATCFCATGSVYVARVRRAKISFGQAAFVDPIVNEVIAALNRLGPLVEFNDAEGRTKEQVIDRFRAARGFLQAELDLAEAERKAAKIAERKFRATR